jgi:4-alpha-glucanotransferase
MTPLQSREAGVCLHLSALPGAHGIGTLGKSAYRFVDFLADAGLSVWQILPVGPTAFGNSPYQTTSVFAGNPMFIDLDRLRERGLLNAAELAPLAALPSDTVCYEELIPLKRELLFTACERFARTADRADRAARDAFVAANDSRWLRDFALFDVLRLQHQSHAWPSWERPYAVRDSSALDAIEAAARSHIDAVKTSQYWFFEQWSELRDYASQRGVRLMGDMPIYVAHDSADCWASPELFSLDADGNPSEVSGVPPDYFSADGQRWGNPLYRWERHAQDDFAWWRARMAHAVTLADMIRLDHFRGFEAYWAIPADEATARNGEWREGPGESLFDSLTTALGPLPVIAEDLGVITPPVEALRDRYDFPGMKVLQFLVDQEDFVIESIPRNSVCYVGTHDNDTVVGWFSRGPRDCNDDDTLRAWQAIVLRNAQGCAETVHLDLVKLAFASPAALALVSIQDFLGLGSEARFNTPGRTIDNWRWRCTSDMLSPHFCVSVAELAARFERTNKQ